MSALNIALSTLRMSCSEILCHDAAAWERGWEAGSGERRRKGRPAGATPVRAVFIHHEEPKPHALFELTTSEHHHPAAPSTEL
jgi:hypothetical protein